MYNPTNYFQAQQQQQQQPQQQPSMDQYRQYSNNSVVANNAFLYQQQQQQQQQPLPSNTNNGQIPQLWMGELDQRWDEATIRHIWSSLLTNMGILIFSVKLIKDKQSFQMGLNNAGYCFVRFKNFEDASLVLNEFNGKPIPGTNNQLFFRLNWSSANIQAAATAAAANSVGNSPMIPNQIQQNIPQISPHVQQAQQQQPQQQQQINQSNSPSSLNDYSIFVGDLPQNINEQILLQTFKSRYPSCCGVKVMIDQTTGNIKGYGFVKFTSEDDQRRALVEMQGFILLGRPIRVSTAAKSNNANKNATFSSSTSLASQSQPLQSSSSSSSSSLQYFNDPANTTVFIGGLNVSLTENQLLELFSKFGDITYVKIPQGKNCGFVQYFHRSCAEMAINEMQGFDIGGGCKIRVSWGARAAQRNWFARQILMQQQQQQQQQPVTTNNQLDLSTLMQMSRSQSAVNTLGLSGGSQLTLNDNILSNNGNYSIDPIPFQNEQIPFTTFSSATPSVLGDDDLKLNSLLMNPRDVGFDMIDKGTNIYNI